MTDYNKTRRVIWTPESTTAFHEMKLAISKCTTMHFLNDTAPIMLHTDASDYGVGAYLFQTVDGRDQLLPSLVNRLISPNFVGRLFRKRLMEYSSPVDTYNHSCVIVFLLYELIIEIYYS